LTEPTAFQQLAAFEAATVVVTGGGDACRLLPLEWQPWLKIPIFDRIKIYK